MGLFTREDAERLSRAVGEMQHDARQAYLDCKLSVWDMRRMLREADAILDSIPRKLAATRMILQDRENMMKSMNFAFVIPRIRGWLMRRGSRQWRPTTEAQVIRLENQGVTIIWYKARRDDEGGSKKQPEEPEFEYEPLSWVRVTELEAKALSKLGYMIRYLGEGDDRTFEASITEDECIKIRAAANGGAAATANAPPSPSGGIVA
jgi:hypothetical protein